MSKLNDTQAILLSNASRRADGSLHPLPNTLADAGVRATKAIASLLKLGFAEERETSVPANVSRVDGDLRYGIFLTAAGQSSIGVEAGVDGEPASSSPASLHREAHKISKRNSVIALLQRDIGATLAELIAATGWLPHTTRAALTGLRKKGHAIDRGKRGEETCYRVTATA